MYVIVNVYLFLRPIFWRHKKVLNVSFNIHWVIMMTVPCNWNPFLVNQKFFKIPSYIIGLKFLEGIPVLWSKTFYRRWAICLHVVIQRMFIGSIHIHLLSKFKQRDKALSRPHILEAVQDLSSIFARLLPPKLITWYAKNLEILKATLQCIQPVVLVSYPSPRGHVNYQYHITTVKVPVNHTVLVDVFYPEIVD